MQIEPAVAFVSSGRPASQAPAAALASVPAVRPVEMPVLDRFASAVVTAAPPIMLGSACGSGGPGTC